MANEMEAGGSEDKHGHARLEVPCRVDLPTTHIPGGATSLQSEIPTVGLASFSWLISTSPPSLVSSFHVRG